MSKEQYIDSYRNYLVSSGQDGLEIPDDYIDEFWDWFKLRAKFFQKERIYKNIVNTAIPIETNSCFKNTYRIAKGFKKNLFYFEGFAYREMDSSFIKHAFNVSKRFKVNDFTLNKLHGKEEDEEENINEIYSIYIGVKIPLNFIQEIYRSRDYKYAQYTCLVPRFMYENNIPNYISYSELS